MSLETNKQAWEDFAELDPAYAILTDQQFRFNKWNLDLFFDTGTQEIEKFWKKPEQ